MNIRSNMVSILNPSYQHFVKFALFKSHLISTQHTEITLHFCSDRLKESIL